MSVITKFCGITTIEDALAAQELGVHAVGCILVPNRPRTITSVFVNELCTKLSESISIVAVIADMTVAQLETLNGQLHSRVILQLHGAPNQSELVDALREWGRSYIKVLPYDLPKQQMLDYVGLYSDSEWLLLDCAQGGSGNSWHIDEIQVDPESMPNFVMAGGLSADNVMQRLQSAQAKGFQVIGVDVSSGIESGIESGVESGIENIPGAKCGVAMQNFATNAQKSVQKSAQNSSEPSVKQSSVARRLSRLSLLYDLQSAPTTACRQQ